MTKVVRYKSFLNLAFFSFVAITLFRGEDRSLSPKEYSIDFKKLQQLFFDTGGENEPYGHEPFAVFRERLPKRGQISFIMDIDYDPWSLEVLKLRRAQHYLVPLMINPEPIEKLAIVACTNKDIADQRLKILNYRWAVYHSGGLGLAIKQ